MHPLIPMSMYHVRRSNEQQGLSDASIKKTLSLSIDHPDIARIQEIADEMRVDIRSYNQKGTILKQASQQISRCQLS